MHSSLVASLLWFTSFAAAAFMGPGGLSAASVAQERPGIDFDAARFHPAGTNVVSVQVQDLDRDSILDIAIGQEGCPGCMPPVSAGLVLLMGRPAGGFEAPRLVGAGVRADTLVSGDFDGDGWIDLAACDTPARAVHVVWNLGGSGFGAPVLVEAGADTVHGAAADLDADGRMEWVTVQRMSRTLTIHRLRREGMLRRSVLLPDGVVPDWVFAGDANGDGKADLVVLSGAERLALVLAGDGQDGFVEMNRVRTGPGPVAVAIRDFDGNGTPDLIVGCQGSAGEGHSDGDVRVFAALAGGVYADPVLVLRGSRPQSLAVQDLDGDGDVDVVVACQGSSIGGHVDAGLAVLRNGGRGALVPFGRYGTGGQTRGLAVGDLDRDGALDCVTGNLVSDGVLEFRGSGDATFAAPVMPATRISPRSVVEDFDHDGWLDLGTTTSAGFRIYRGGGDGTFAVAAGTSGPIVGGAARGDFNGDGLTDIAGSGSESGFVVVALTTREGQFAAEHRRSTGRQPRALAVGDFVRDGYDDIAVALGPAPGAIWVLTLGSGGLFDREIRHDARDDISSMRSADFDGDGRVDLAVTLPNLDGVGGPGTVLVYLGDGTGRLRLAASQQTGPGATSMRTGDFNGDGIVDLVTADAEAGGVSVLLGRGDGSFRSRVAYRTGRFPYAVEAYDMDRDGLLDLVVGNSGSPSIAVLRGSGDGSFTLVGLWGGGVNLSGVLVGDFDGNGRRDLAAGGTVFLNRAEPGVRRLAARMEAGAVVVEWRFPAAGFELESTTEISSGIWRGVAAAAEVADGRWGVRLPAEAPARYFRLRRP